MHCETCQRVFRPRTINGGSQCPPCWRLGKRGPALRGLFKLFETLCLAHGCVQAAAEYIGVNRNTVLKWRTGQANPRAESVLALDEYSRLDAVMRRADALSGVWSGHPLPFGVVRPPPPVKPPPTIPDVKVNYAPGPSPITLRQFLELSRPRTPVVAPGTAER